MPIIIEGYVVVSAKTLTEHKGHHLSAEDDEFGPRLWCNDDAVVLAAAPQPSTSLPCGCPDLEEHTSGVALQTKFRKEYRIAKYACVGCYLGDDGPSLHSCYVHEEKYWPEA